MAIEIVDFPIQHEWIFHSKLLVYQRVTMENHHLYNLHMVKCPMKKIVIFHSCVSSPEGNIC